MNNFKFHNFPNWQNLQATLLQYSQDNPSCLDGVWNFVDDLPTFLQAVPELPDMFSPMNLTIQWVSFCQRTQTFPDISSAAFEDTCLVYLPVLNTENVVVHLIETFSPRTLTFTQNGVAYYSYPIGASYTQLDEFNVYEPVALNPQIPKVHSLNTEGIDSIFLAVGFIEDSNFLLD